MLPLYFFLKNLSTSFLVASSAVSPLISSSQKLTTFFAHRFIAFYCFHSGVTPPRGCHPTPFLPIRPRFSTILCKFAHTIFSFGCHPLEGVTRGGPLPSPLSVVTPLTTGTQRPMNAKNFISSSLITDTSLAKIHRRSDQ